MTNDLSPNPAVTLDRALDQALGSGTAAGSWRLDPQKSSVEFHARVLWGLAPVRGTFRIVEGGGRVAADGTVVGALSIGADSLETGNPKRDAHLRGKDFFDVGNHPALVVKISGADRIGNSRLRVAGALQILDATRPIAFDAAVVALSESTVQLRAELVVDRHEFGLTWNQLGMLTRNVTARVLLSLARDSA